MEWIGSKTASPQKVRLPAEWNDLFGSCSGQVRLTRKFHQPTNLGPSQQVDLVFRHWPGVWAVTLNQRHVAELRSPNPERVAITSFLQPANVLTVETQIEQPAGQRARGDLFGEVALEIRGN
jgi:hypothetical protein